MDVGWIWMKSGRRYDVGLSVALLSLLCVVFDVVLVSCSVVLIPCCCCFPSALQRIPKALLPYEN